MARPSEGRHRSLPTIGLGCTLVCLVAMAAITWAAWDLLPAMVTTREASDPRGAIRVPRALFVSLAPVAAVLVSALVVAAAPLDRAIERRLGLQVGGDARARARNLDAVLAVMGVLFLVVHCLVVIVGTGESFPVLPTVGISVGVLLAIMGVLTSSAARSWSTPADPGVRAWAGAWRRVQPLAGRTMIVSGLLLALVAPAVFVLLPGTLTGMLVTAVATVAATLLPFGVALAAMVASGRRPD
ncbi:hypothetical protein [Nocardiopsis sp. FIRDI 009]|uniref:hypothetical protein n=1 Tax=Nocardiopsis sp. FIRDI 009 TaxID=714197 RepID=UPI000E25DF2B|nr:hypothetical protein [Nocardiopsis sp. FIRDI 009]